MNQLKLSLRAADDPRTIKEENGVPTFAFVCAVEDGTPRAGSATGAVWDHPTPAFERGAYDSSLNPCQ